MTDVRAGFAVRLSPKEIFRVQRRRRGDSGYRQSECVVSGASLPLWFRV